MKTGKFCLIASLLGAFVFSSAELKAQCYCQGGSCSASSGYQSACNTGTYSYGRPFFSRPIFRLFGFGRNVSSPSYCGVEYAPSACSPCQTNSVRPYEYKPSPACGIPSKAESVVTSPSESTSCSSCSSASEPCDQCSTIESRLLSCISTVRRGGLALDVNLCKWARYNSQLQAQYGSVGHYAGGGIEIAAVCSTPEQAVNMWLNSPSHRAILLTGGYTKVGVGVVRGTYGTYWTARFSR